MFAAFDLYGIGHTGALVCLAAISILMILRCRKGADSGHAKSVLSLLTFCCFAAYPINQAAWEYTGGAITLIHDGASLVVRIPSGIEPHESLLLEGTLDPLSPLRFDINKFNSKIKRGKKLRS